MKKLFGIEKKLIKPILHKIYNANMEYIGESKIKCFLNDWHLHGKYSTEKRRDAAFDCLVRKSDLFEYRKVNL